MKTINIIVASALAGALLACNPLTIEIKPAKGSFTAQGDGFSTKTSLSGTSVIWSDGDAIKVFNGTGSEEYTIESGQGSSTAVFSGNEIEAETYYAVYPYSVDASLSAGVITATVPAAQYGVVNSFDNDINLAVAKSNNHTLQFKNVCGYLRFQIIESDITEIIIKSNGAEALAGDVDITFDGDGLPVVGSVANPSSTITILPKSPATHFAPGVYIAAVLPREYANGIEMSFTRLHAKEDALKVWPLKAKKSGSSSLTVSRSVVKSLGIVDKQLAWECKGLNDNGVPVGTYNSDGVGSYGQFIDYQSGRSFGAIGTYSYRSILDACFAYNSGYGVLSPASSQAGSLYNVDNIRKLAKDKTLTEDNENIIVNWPKESRKTTYFAPVSSLQIANVAAYNALSSYSDIQTVYEGAYEEQEYTDTTRPIGIWTNKEATSAATGAKITTNSGFYAFKMSEGGHVYYGVMKITYYSTSSPIMLKFTYKIACERTGTPEAIPE